MINILSKSKRQKNWKRYSYLNNSCKNLNFQCQCGKKYVSFPGLYLHFKRKHGAKISTKFKENKYQIIKSQNKTTYKYSYIDTANNNIGEIEEKQQTYNSKQKLTILTVLQYFLQNYEQGVVNKQHYPNNSQCHDFAHTTINSFRKYIIQKMHQNKLYSRQIQIINDMPNFFNSFMQQQQAERQISPYEYDQTCIIMLSLSNWLARQGYTNLTVQLNYK